jgi:hypothetical protein
MAVDFETALKAAESNAAPGVIVERAEARELRDGWFFPYVPVGEPLCGSTGVIVNKRTGQVLQLGSAYPVERDIEAYNEGFQFESYDVVVTEITDLGRALDVLEQLGLSVVTPQEDHGVTWRIPRLLNRSELARQLRTLPCTFPDVRLYFRVEALQLARREGYFAFHTHEHRKPGAACQEDGADEAR